jgi:two-component system, cell cycle response regulator
MKILIAEDDPVSALVLERTLQRWGYEVVKATNGAEAWELFQSDPVPIIITDWEMPQADGLELCRRIRKFHQGSYTYVILLTAKNQKVELVEGMNSGADDFISKPFHTAELEVRLRAGERVLALERSLWQGKQEIQQINTRLQKSFERESLLNQLLRSLTSSLDFEAGLRGAVQPLQALFKASRACVRLVRQEKKLLQLVAEHCAPESKTLGRRFFPLEHFPGREDAEFNSSHVFSDLERVAPLNFPGTLRNLAQSEGVKALLSEPLIMQGMWFGDISLHQCDAPRVWLEEEIQLLKTVAQQISVIAVNSELHRKVQEQSVRDGLTGLFNRRYFDESLKIEFERASRYDHPLTLVMLDLDYLKKINDELGHLAGDEAIRLTGEILLKQSRRVDIATRYGGEEFVVILPQTTVVGGRAASEHWLQSINQCQIGNRRLSASIGLASFPQHGNTAHQLLKAADRALYRAKHAGRNRVCEAVEGEGDARKAEV